MPTPAEVAARTNTAGLAQARELGTNDLDEADPTADGPFAVSLDPTCCAVRRRQERWGQTVAHLVEHQVDCPVWSAR